MATLQTKSKNYEEFTEKFKPKKTTDDCYAPDNIMEAVFDYVENTYNVPRKTFIRPFWPGGDYEAEDYSGKIVVDNPPFSIMSKILNFYTSHNVKFFIFCNALTAFGNLKEREDITLIHVFIDIVYQNGAKVRTSFLTNLEPEGVAVRTDPDLKMKLTQINDKNKGIKKVTKRTWPPNITSAALLGKYTSKNITIKHGDYKFVREYDGAGIFGGGFLLNKDIGEYVDYV